MGNSASSSNSCPKIPCSNVSHNSIALSPSQAVLSRLLQGLIQDHTSLNSKPPTSIPILSITPSHLTLKRSKVLNTHQYPYSANGLISIQINETNTSYGSGTSIGPYYVLTAAHNLHDKYSGLTHSPSQIRYYPAISGSILSSQEIEVNQVCIPNEYIQSTKDDYLDDYAVLVLNTPLSTGYLGIKAITEEDLESKTVHIYGYPSDKMNRGCFEMWGCAGSCEIMSDKSIVHKLDSYTGMSGSNNNRYYIVGIHSSEDKTKDLKYATYITHQRIQRIQYWIEESIARTCLNAVSMDSSSLDLTRIYRTYDIIDILESIPYNIKHLNLSQNKLNLRHIQQISKVDYSQMNILNLSCNRIGSKGCIALCRGFYPELNRLDLSSNEIESEGLKIFSVFCIDRLTELKLSSNRLDAKAMKYLAKCELPTLRSLDLEGNQVGSAGLTNLQKCRFMQLEILNISSNHIGDLGVQALSHCCFPQLLSLYLGDNSLHASSMEYLSCCIFPNLRTLSLEHNYLSSNTSAYLSTCNFPHLSYLNLAYNLLTSSSLSNLSVCNFTHLSSLNISFNRLDSLPILHFNELKTLDLSLNTNSISSLESLSISLVNLSSTTSSLKILNLYGNYVGYKGVYTIAQCNLNALRELDLGNNRLGPTGIKALSTCSLSNLRKLNLERNEIGPEGLEYLIRCRLDSLTHLNLYCNQLRETAVYLTECSFPKLKSMNLEDNYIGTDLANKIRTFFKHLKIEF